jgi:peptidoglycan-associated lipoprotein
MENTARVGFTDNMRKIQTAFLLLALAGCAKKHAPNQISKAVPPQPPASHASSTPAVASRSNSTSSIPAGSTDDRDRALKNALANLNAALGDAMFDFDKANLRPDAVSALTQDASVLQDEIKKDPSLIFTVEGHCDERGSAEYNLALGDRRAEKAKEFLGQLGLPADHLKTISYGESRPVCQESTEECWQKNRRAHLTYERASR